MGDENEVDLKDKENIEESDFSSDPETEVKSEEAKKVEQVRRVDLSDTVSEFSDDDDELFKPKPTEEPVKTPVVSQSEEASTHDSGNVDPGEEEKQPKTGPLNFADELSSKLSLSVAPKLRNSDVKMDEDLKPNQGIDRVEEGSKPRPKLIQKSTLFDSSDSDDDLFSGKALHPKKYVKPEKPKKEIEPPRTDKNNALPVSDVNREKAPPPAAIIPPAKSKLFIDSTDDESDNEEPDIFADLKVAKPK